MKNKNILSALSVLILASLACSLFGAPAPTPAPGDNSALPSEPVVEEASPTPQPADCFNAYYPVKEGATWTYQISGTSTDTFTRSIISATDSEFTDQDAFGSGTTRTGQWRCENGALISLTPGGGAAAVSAAGQTMNFTVTANSGITIPARMDAGSAWSQDISFESTQDAGGTQVTSQNQAAISCTVIGRESVTVPAGTFDALKVECQSKITITIAGMSPIVFEGPSISWYAEGVGMVKNVGSAAGYETTIELTAYQIP